MDDFSDYVALSSSEEVPAHTWFSVGWEDRGRLEKGLAVRVGTSWFKRVDNAITDSIRCRVPTHIAK